MSITAVAVEAVRDGRETDVGAAVRRMEEALDGAAEPSWAAVEAAALLDLVARLGRLASRVAALRLAGPAEADRRAAARDAGMRSTGAWLRTTGVRAGQAHREVGLAGALTGMDLTRRALGAGD